MRTFYGRREDGVCRIRVTEELGGWPADGRSRLSDKPVETELPGCPELFKGQALPFNWGMDTPGTAHAAAAILVRMLGGGNQAMPAIRAFFPVLRRFLAELPVDDFELSESFLLAFLHAARETQSPAVAG